jgi:hypothetical protein
VLLPFATVDETVEQDPIAALLYAGFFDGGAVWKAVLLLFNSRTASRFF